MAQMADEIRKRRARPGIWVRPLIAKKSADANLLLPASRFGTRTSRAQDLAYDPTIPEALNAAMWQRRFALHLTIIFVQVTPFGTGSES